MPEFPFTLLNKYVLSNVRANALRLSSQEQDALSRDLLVTAENYLCGKSGMTEALQKVLSKYTALAESERKMVAKEFLLAVIISISAAQEDLRKLYSAVELF